MRRKQLSKKEIQELNELICKEFSLENFFSRKERVELADNLFVLGNEPVFYVHEGRVVPTLRLLAKNNFLKRVAVDMGAVRFVASGADIMRPGITRIDPGIQEGELVAVVDETHEKPIAVARALKPASELEEMERGKALKNIHFVGDKIWNFSPLKSKNK